MKATGIVRRIDDLGRVVIPKEIRRTLRIREGDPLEIYTDIGGEVIFKKYSQMGELSSFASQYTDVLYKAASLPTVICDKDHIIAVSGFPKKEFLERRITSTLDDLMEQRKIFIASDPNQKILPIEGVEKLASIIFPIISSGDIMGAIISFFDESFKLPSETEIKLLQTASSFLAKQMEE